MLYLNPTGSGVGAKAGVAVEIKGNDLDALRERAKEVKLEMTHFPNFYGIKINPTDLVPELKVQIDREKTIHLLDEMKLWPVLPGIAQMIKGT